MNAGAYQEPHFGCVAVGWVPNRARIFFFPFFSVFPYKFSAPRSWHPEAKGLSAGRLSGRWVAGGTGGGLKKKTEDVVHLGEIRPARISPGIPTRKQRIKTWREC